MNVTHVTQTHLGIHGHSKMVCILLVFSGKRIQQALISSIFTYMYFDQIIVLNKNEFCNSLDSIITYADANFNQLNMYKESMTKKTYCIMLRDALTYMHIDYCFQILTVVKLTTRYKNQNQFKKFIYQIRNCTNSPKSL